MPRFLDALGTAVRATTFGLAVGALAACSSCRAATPAGSADVEGTIPLGILQFLSPAPGEPAWQRESRHLVAWRYVPPPGASDDLQLEMSLDDGATFLPVEAELFDRAAQTARIAVPASGGTSLRLRLVATGAVLESTQVTLAPSQKRDYVYEKLTEAAPFGPRDGMGGVVFHGRLFAMGGWNPIKYPKTSTLNDVWSSADGKTWVLEKANTFLDPATFDAEADWPGRHCAGYLVHDDKIFIVGGDPLQGGYQNDVWSSGDGRRWTKVTRNWGVSPTRAFHMTAETGGKMWVMGGQNLTDFGGEPIPAGGLSDVFTSLDGKDWKRVPTEGPMWSGRGIIGNQAVLGGRLWIVGGGLYDDPKFPGGVFFGDAWSTTDGSKWKLETAYLPFPKRVYHSVAVFDDRLWVLGGVNTYGNLADNWYSSDGFNWYPSTHPNLVGRHAGTVWVSGTTMYWGSGNAIYDDSKTSKWLADVWRIRAP